jgi:hypothetical protein
MDNKTIHQIYGIKDEDIIRDEIKKNKIKIILDDDVQEDEVLNRGSILLKDIPICLDSGTEEHGLVISLSECFWG